jgi:hypothetical protein
MKTIKKLAILYLLLGTIAAYSMDEAHNQARKIAVKSVTFNTANDSNNTSPAMMSSSSSMTALNSSASNSPVACAKSITSPMAVTKRLLDEEYLREEYHRKVHCNEDSDNDSSDSDSEDSYGLSPDEHMLMNRCARHCDKLFGKPQQVESDTNKK